MRVLPAIVASLLVASVASAAVTSTTQHDVSSMGLDGQIVVGDVLSGLIATELPGDQGWHGANTDPLDQLPAFTDDAGIRGSGLTGLLNDFPPVLGDPVKLIRYDLPGTTDVGEIRVLTGTNGMDGRIFSTFTVYTSTDNGGSFDLLGYFESDPLGTLNHVGSDPRYGSTLVSVFDDASPVLVSGVTNIQFNFFAVDNNGGQYRDPYDGINPFTGIDDGLTAAFVSPLVLEIDVIAAIPEPASVLLVCCGLLGFVGIRRR